MSRLGSFFPAPIPAAFENPWKMRLFTGILKMSNWMVDVGEWMGLGHRMNLTRRLMRGPRARDAALLERVTTRDAVLDGVSVRIYKPRSESPSGPLPVWVYYHGGGWVMGSIAVSDVLCRRVVLETGIAVVSVEYRLAPEHPYPAALDDCHKVASYVLEHAVELGFDPVKVLVGGESSGGNLAAGVSLRMKNAQPPLAAQLLIYPVVQTLTLSLPSFLQPFTPLLDRPRQLSFRLLYFLGQHNASWTDVLLRGGHVTSAVRQRYSKYVDYRLLPEEFRRGYVEPPLAAVDEELAKLLEPFVTNTEINPLLSDQLAGLPPTLVLTAGYDPVRDEGTLFAMRLKEAGVKVEHLHYEHGFHGMIGMTEEPFRFQVAVTSFHGVLDYIRSRVAH